MCIRDSYKALQDISENPQEKTESRAAAEGLCHFFGRIEIAVLLVLWNDILERFNAASKTMQSISTCLLYTSYIGNIL